MRIGIYIVCLVAIIGCKTTQKVTESSTEWHWQKTLGGISGRQITPENTRHDFKLQFFKGDSLRVLIDDRVDATLRYKLVDQKDRHGKQVTILKFSKKYANPFLILNNGVVTYSEDGNTLTIAEPYIDGMASIFTK